MREFLRWMVIAVLLSKCKHSPLIRSSHSSPATNGVDTNRLAMLVAVLYRHAREFARPRSLCLHIAGGSAKEPSCDVAIAAALVSAMTNKPIARTTAAIGEISLTGQVRPDSAFNSSHTRSRGLVLPRILCHVYARGAKKEQFDGVTIIEVATVGDVVRELGFTR